MKNVIDYFIKRSFMVNLLTVALLLIGTIALTSLQREIFPSVDFDWVVVSTSYPGSSAEDVEKLVTISIERNLKSVEGIKELHSSSREGFSVVYMEIDPDYDIDEVLDDIKTAVDTTTDLPEDVEIPLVKKITNKSHGVLKVAITGDEYQKLRVVSKRLRDEIELIPEVSQVKLEGYRIDEIRIEVNPDKLNQYELTFSEIAQAIKDRNLNLSAGQIKTSRGDIFIRTVAEFITEEDIKGVVIRSNTTGRNIKISDVAKIIRTPEEGSIFQRSMGERAIFLEINSKETSDIINTSEKLKKKTNEFFKKGNFEGVKYRFTDDLSYYVRNRLDILKSNGLYGLVLVVTALLLFLNFRTSIITSLGAPIAFLAAFICMDIMGISINMISMFALILVLGMLVDDAIIVAEQFYQKIERGIPPSVAARDAAFETIRPVIATILTTMVAFGSLFFMGGIMGKFLWPVPAVVIICLTASLLECFFILPSHLAEFGKLSKKQQSNGDKTRWYEPIRRVYGILLKKFLNHPLKVLVFFVLVFVGSVIMAFHMKFELFPGDDVRIVFINIKGKVGAPLYKTDEAVKKVEELTLKEIREDELDQIRSYIGKQRGRHSVKVGDHYGMVIAYLTQPHERERHTDDILRGISDQLKDLVPGYEIKIKKMQGGPPKGEPVEIVLTGGNLDNLRDLSKRVEKKLSSIEGVTSTAISFEEGKIQVIVDVDDKEARRLGLSTKQIALELRRAFAGDSLTEIRESDEDIEVRIFLDDKSRSKMDTISKLYILNNQGKRIPMKRVVKFVEKPGAFVIERMNRKRKIDVSASLDKKIITPIKIAELMRPELEKIMKDYPDARYEFGGEHKDTMDSMKRLLKSGIIALICIFFILMVMFTSIGQPLIIMTAIPLGLIGVIITFKILNLALGFMALMGVVALIGVVVNDSIVLVNFINKRRKERDSIIDAIHEACLTRFRPVILTTFTTVAGLLPLAHAPTGDPFIRPMAISFAWGLFFATTVTLIFIPCNYLIYDRFTSFLKRKFKRKDQTLAA